MGMNGDTMPDEAGEYGGEWGHTLVPKRGENTLLMEENKVTLLIGNTLDE
jgi:hypothetical protein